MSQGLTKLVFVIDRSLSMKKIESYMIDGLNNFFGDQKNRNLGECQVSVYKFNHQYDVVFESVSLNSITPLTKQDFQPNGFTALLDAIGTTIQNVDVEINALPVVDRPDRVLMVIWTDGLENSSQTYTGSLIHDMIQQKTVSSSWDFAYVSTTQDEGTVGRSYGVSGNSSADYVASAEGVEKMFDTLGKSMSQFRSASFRTNFQFENKKNV